MRIASVAAASSGVSFQGCMPGATRGPFPSEVRHGRVVRRMGSRRRERVRISTRPISSAAGIDRVNATRPLSQVLEFMRSLWGVNHALESASRRMKARYGVTGPERMVVRLVGRYPGISSGDLARILLVHPSTLTALLKRLVARKVLTRHSDVLDGRRALFELTEKGAVIDRVTRGTVEAALTMALASISRRDVRTTASVLDELTRSLEENG